jgi:inositol oxygenase
MQVTALLHDLGKNLYLWGSEEEGTGQKNQFALVGDTWAVGCRIPDGVVYPEFNSLNPDMKDPVLSSELGIYEEGCGLENLIMAWGHDEYMYRVLKVRN